MHGQQTIVSLYELNFLNVTGRGQVPELNVKIYNHTGQDFWVYPACIYFNIFRHNGLQPRGIRISETPSKANKDHYLLPANDSTEFNISTFAFSDFIYEVDSLYYFEAVRVPNAYKKKIGTFLPIKENFKADTFNFKLCKE